MTELSPFNKPNGQVPHGGVILSGRQLTITIDPRLHAMLNDLAKVTQQSVHDAATLLLSQAIQMAHDDLKRQKFIWLLANWLTWADAKVS